MLRGSYRLRARTEFDKVPIRAACSFLCLFDALVDSPPFSTLVQNANDEPAHLGGSHSFRVHLFQRKT